MTDKELDEKLRCAFDEVRADNAVKARIRERLTGDNMDVERIITDDSTNENGTNERKGIKVSYYGKAAAAVAASVLLLAGGVMLFKYKAPEIDTDRHNAGVTTSDEDVTEHKMFFDADGETMYDKFGENSNIWKLKNGRYLIKQADDLSKVFDENEPGYFTADESLASVYYALYDPKEETVTAHIRSNNNFVRVYDDCFVTWRGVGVKSPENDNDISGSLADGYIGQVYDLDLEPVGDELVVRAPGDMKMLLGDIPEADTEGSVYYRVYNTIAGTRAMSGSRLYKDDEALFAESGTDVLYDCKLSGDRKHLYISRLLADSATLESVIRSSWYELPYNGTPVAELESDLSANSVRPFVFADKLGVLSNGGSEDENNIYLTDAQGNKEKYSIEGISGTEAVMGAYVTHDGRYLIASVIEMGNVYTEDEDDGALLVYDIEDDFKLVCRHDCGMIVYRFTDGCDLLFDEESGDLCFAGYIYIPDGEDYIVERKVGRFNIYDEKNEYTQAEDLSGAAGAIEKFGSNAWIYELSDGRYLAKRYLNNSGSGDQPLKYSIYDAGNNEIPAVMETGSPNAQIIDNGFVLYDQLGGDRINAAVYDNDMNEVTEFVYDSDKKLCSVQAVTFSGDGKTMYVAAKEKAENEDKAIAHFYSVDENNKATEIAVFDERDIRTLKLTDDGTKLGIIEDFGSENNSTDMYVMDISEGTGSEIRLLGGGNQFYVRGNKFYICGYGGVMEYGKDLPNGESFTDYDMMQQIYEDNTFRDTDSYPNYYVTKDGKYVVSIDKSDRTANTVKVSRIGDTELELLYEERIEGRSIPIFENDANIFFNEETGEFCAGAWDLDGNGGYSVYTANVFE